jgi:phage terminase large subunit GpA-like protein
LREIEGRKVRPASYLEHWDLITERVIHGTYRVAEGRELRVWRVAVDTGGYAEDKDTQTTARAYDWYRAIRRKGLSHRVKLIKGSESGERLVRESYPDAMKAGKTGSASRGDVPVLIINSTPMKDRAYADLLRDVPGPGYIHLARWTPPGILDELVSETREPKRWEKIAKRRNETWDALYCADALCIHFGADRVNWERPPPWADPDMSRNSEVITPDQRRSLKAPKRKRRATPQHSIAPDDWSL